jgi:hypothetical protein
LSLGLVINLMACPRCLQTILRQFSRTASNSARYSLSTSPNDQRNPVRRLGKVLSLVPF